MKKTIVQTAFIIHNDHQEFHNKITEVVDKFQNEGKEVVIHYQATDNYCSALIEAVEMKRE